MKICFIASYQNTKEAIENAVLLLCQERGIKMICFTENLATSSSKRFD
jgi:hypothetical protein